jgi:RNA-binding protein
MALTSKQRQFLRGLAHPLSPVVRIGKGKLSEAVIEETKKTFLAHELIKVRIDAEGAERTDLAEQLAQASESEVAGVIGKTAILFRADDEKPRIKLPS